MSSGEILDWKEGCEPSGMNCPDCGKEMLTGEIITLGRCAECENEAWREIIGRME